MAIYTSRRKAYQTYDTKENNRFARLGDIADLFADTLTVSGASTLNTIALTGPVQVDVVSEATSGAGIVADSVKLKDGNVLFGSTGLISGAPTPGASLPSSYFVFFDDFIRPAASAAPLAEWTVTEDDAADTQLIGDAAGGILTLTQKATTDNDASQIQHQTEAFRMIAGKEIWFETRIRCAAGDADNLDFFIGLAAAEDLTAVADNMPANGFGFHKDDAAAVIDLSTSDNGANVESSTVHTLVDATWVRLGFHFDGGATGSGVITPYIDGVAGTAITTAAYATMVEVTPTFMLRNGDNVVTQTLEIDYIYVAQER